MNAFILFISSSISCLRMTSLPEFHPRELISLSTKKWVRGRLERFHLQFLRTTGKKNLWRQKNVNKNVKNAMYALNISVVAGGEKNKERKQMIESEGKWRVWLTFSFLHPVLPWEERSQVVGEGRRHFSSHPFLPLFILFYFEYSSLFPSMHLFSSSPSENRII